MGHYSSVKGYLVLLQMCMKKFYGIGSRQRETLQTKPEIDPELAWKVEG